MSAVRNTYDNDNYNYNQDTSTDRTLNFNLIIPNNFSDIKQVSSYIPNGIPVLINFSKITDKKTVYRALDYLNGYVDCCSGTLKRLSSQLILIAPYSLSYDSDITLDLYGDKEYDKDFEFTYF